MAEIKGSFGSGGSNLAPDGGAGVPSLAQVLRDGVDDVTVLRNAMIALLQKLDADAGVTDVDYEATLTPAALSNTKG